MSGVCLLVFTEPNGCKRQRHLDEPCSLASTILWFLEKEKEILEIADLAEQVQFLHVEQEAMETSSQQDLERKVAGLRNEVQRTLSDLTKLLDKTEDLIHTLVKKELVEWQRRQQKSCIGAPDNVCLDQLENWFTCVAVCLFQVREAKLEELVGKVSYDNHPVKAQKPALQRRTDALLQDLLKRLFVQFTKRGLVGCVVGLFSSHLQRNPVSVAAPKEERVQSARHIISDLRVKLQGKIQDHLHIQGNVSCEELLSASTVDDPSSSMFPQELLGLSLVPVLVVASCPQEAQTLVLKLYDLLGVVDTEELLMEVEGLIERKMSKSASTPTPATPSEIDQGGHHMEAVMFNIQQLAMVGEGTSKQEGHCEGWTRVNGTMAVGRAVKGATGDLEEAVSTCERLGVLQVKHTGCNQAFNVG